jgi:putative oxidoreductase
MDSSGSKTWADEAAGRRGELESGSWVMRQPATSLAAAFVRGTGRVDALEQYAPFAARLLISQIFLLSGIMKILDPSGTAAQMEGRGMFWVPLFLVGAIAIEIGGGLSLLLGYKARLGALALLLFLIPVTLVFHNWWTYPDPKEQHVNMLFFLHNLTLMGGLLLIMAFGPGAASLDLSKGRSP